MNKRTKIILVGVAILILMSLVFYLSIPKKQIGQVTAPIEKLTIDNQYKGAILFKLETTDFKAPSTLPVLEVASLAPINKSEATSVAKKIGFSSDPITINDATEGETNIWSDAKNSLAIYSRTNRLSFTANTIGDTTNKQLSDGDISSIATKFIDDSGFASSQNLKVSSVKYLADNPVEEGGATSTSRSSAIIFEVSFAPRSSEIEIVTIDPSMTNNFIWVLKDGSIARAELVRTGEIKTSAANYKIKDYSALSASLNEAVLVSLDQGTINISDLPKSVERTMNITQIKLAYLAKKYEPNIYQPVFLLEGLMYVREFNKNSKAQAYIPAIE